jgi:hypothetical protein
MTTAAIEVPSAVMIALDPNSGELSPDEHHRQQQPEEVLGTAGLCRRTGSAPELV